MHGIIIYRHIGRTGLGWMDGQKSPVFRLSGKSGNPIYRAACGMTPPTCIDSCSAQNEARRRKAEFARSRKRRGYGVAYGGSDSQNGRTRAGAAGSYVRDYGH